LAWLCDPSEPEHPRAAARAAVPGGPALERLGPDEPVHAGRPTLKRLGPNEPI